MEQKPFDNLTPPPTYESSIIVPYPLPPQNIVPPIVIAPQPINYGPDSILAVCPHCHTRAYTRVESHVSTRTHMTALFLFCFLCWPCVCLPYCCDNCQNRTHYCSRCNVYLGVYEN